IPAFIHMGVKVLDQAQLFYREYGPVTLPYGGDDLPTPEKRRIVYNPTKAAVINLDLAPRVVKIADNSSFCHTLFLLGIQHDISHSVRPIQLDQDSARHVSSFSQPARHRSTLRHQPG